MTEGDLECHLFNKLLCHQELTGYFPSKDALRTGERILTSYIHSQVTWFKPDKSSGFEVDITVADPKFLEVKNLEMFEDFPHKGFAYDGPCVAIELKFIRNFGKAKHQAQEDFLKLRDKLIPAKIHNIEQEKYKISNMDNIAFICVIGCKNKEIFEEAAKYLGRQLCDKNKLCPSNLFTCIFYQDELMWNDEIIQSYREKHSTTKQ
ncbi:hypothetical protein [Chryseobacterium sp. 18068]|uniref:hypothetical protein n=1 Tax=Chryseobacterium sp. 18068 TaxID=2681414 RepID=UPI00135A8489|nr:hypothetical protein [Chryseobacterium sp. 18068]